MSFLPKQIEKVGVPPIKCQGIKTKLVRFIANNLKWDADGKWVEPFLGSGVVLFNICPPKAIVSDTNKHIIKFYQDIQSGKLHGLMVREYLEETGNRLLEQGEDFFYQVREEFNQKGGSLRFLFLNRSCFNGMMRFNGKGEFNVPFCRKPDRFRPSYVTKIVNQVNWVAQKIKRYDWEFRISDWRETLTLADTVDFVYLDPPYIGRHTDYFNRWEDNDAIELAQITQKLNCGFALSMWKENKYRANSHITNYWDGLPTKTFSHFYHIGSSEKYRNRMIEALVIKNSFENKIEPKFSQATTASLFD